MGKQRKNYFFYDNIFLYSVIAKLNFNKEVKL